MGPSYQYAATLQRVIDGDTYQMEVDLGFRIYHDIHVRLKDFDTPELRAKNPHERAHAIQARDFVVALLPAGTRVVLLTAKAALYNRWQAEVWYETPAGVWVSLANTLSDAGFAKKREVDTHVPPTP